ncbi:hypothetical protein [Phenylobacterium sp.]|jgi:hypothetical protein|uniref:hypothetical protein n=1 Tax=Phenylobacterium sp. TaxID=1871053 RepID=UPI002E324A07|nr:hypothetical protein [Phenylobacterium sp.]HEX2558555.1 hypothetical protein [Phenylobacterium sp.]
MTFFRFSLAWAAALLATGLPASAQDLQPLDLELVCDGAFMTRVRTTTSVDVEDEDGNEATGTSISRTSVPVPRRILISISGDSGRVKLPADMDSRRGLAPDGWRPFQELVVSEDKIEARLRFNALAKVRIVIDRMTGDIDYDGGEFRGVCDKARAPLNAKRF